MGHGVSSPFWRLRGTVLRTATVSNEESKANSISYESSFAQPFDPTTIHNTSLCEVWLELSNAMTYTHLVVGLELCAQTIIPRLFSVFTFLLTPDTGEIEMYGRTGCLCKLLPRSGLILDVMKKKVPSIRTGVQVNDPLYTILDLAKHNKDKTCTVIVTPLQLNTTSYGCYIILCDSVTKYQQECIGLMQKYVLAAARRVVEHELEKYAHNRADKMLNFCVDLYQMNSTNLIETILKQVKVSTDADFTALMVPDELGTELLIHLCDGGFQMESITIDLNKSLYGHLLGSETITNLGNITKDPRFNEECDTLTGREMHTLICLPIKTQVQSIVCAFNKRGMPFNTFTRGDEEALSFTMNFCGPILNNALSYEQQLSSRERTQALLKVAQNLFTRFDSVNVLLREIMQEARMLTKAESCSVFLVDKITNELVAKVFDGTLIDEDTSNKEIRIPINKGIAGHVALTGKLLNIKDAYSNPLFYRGVDEDTGFVTKNILCFPIKDDTGVIGIAQLCNKEGGKYFTRLDEEAALSFSVYCGISISNSLLFKRVQDAQYRSKLASDLMIYHMQVPQVELEVALDDLKMTASPPPCFTSLLFPTYIVEEETQTISLAYHMFYDMKLVHRWQMLPHTLVRFLLMVKRGYRDPPYHNWMHAFCVGHFFYALTKTCDISDYFTDIEVLAMMVACLCHDLDHRGTTNAFQVASKSVLACLYSSEGSVMERHHFAQTLCILNTSGCNIMEGMTTNEYKEGLDKIQMIILATDLAQHLRIISQQKEMATSGYDISNPHHHYLLSSLVVTSCDLSINVKLFEESSIIVRDHIYTEFFSEGDMEKQLGRTPMQQKDRKKACIPSLQIKFSDFIAAPLYTLMVQLFPAAVCVTDQLSENHAIWDSIAVKHSMEENHNCIKYDTYVSTQQSQRNIEKSLSSYASKLTTQSHALKQTDKRFSKIEEIANDWNNGLESGDIRGTREHVKLITEYNRTLIVQQDEECPLRTNDNKEHPPMHRKTSEDTGLKRRLHLSYSSPSATSPPRSQSTPNTPTPRTPILRDPSHEQIIVQDVNHEEISGNHTSEDTERRSSNHTSENTQSDRTSEATPCGNHTSDDTPRANHTSEATPCANHTSETNNQTERRMSDRQITSVTSDKVQIEHVEVLQGKKKLNNVTPPVESSSTSLPTLDNSTISFVSKYKYDKAGSPEVVYRKSNDNDQPVTGHSNNINSNRRTEESKHCTLHNLLSHDKKEEWI